MKSLIVVIFVVLLSSCSTNKVPSNRDADLAAADKILLKYKKQAEEMEKRDRVNKNWLVRCNTDPVSDYKKCFAGTFGYPMDSNGDPYNTKGIPFQVFYLNGKGPYFTVGFNTYPGREPLVKIDSNSPIRLNKYGNAGDNTTKLLFLLENGSILRGEYHVWPRGLERVYVELKGFGEANRKLQAKIK